MQSNNAIHQSNTKKVAMVESRENPNKFLHHPV